MMYNLEAMGHFRRNIKKWNISVDYFVYVSLRWRHNELDGVSDHQPHDCLLNRLFGRRSKRTSKLRVTGLCAGNSPGTGEFSAQMASNAENVSIWWRHHEFRTLQIPFFIHNIARESRIKVIIHVCGWCQAILSISKYQIRVFPLCFPNTPYYLPVMYKQYIRKIMKTNIRLYSVLNWIVDVSACRRFGLSMFSAIDVWVCRRFGLSTIWSVDVSVCRRFGLWTFWLSAFRFVDVLASYLQTGPF